MYRYHSFTDIYNGSCDNQLTVSYHLRATQSVSSGGIYDHSCAQAPLQMKGVLVSLWYALFIGVPEVLSLTAKDGRFTSVK